MQNSIFKDFAALDTEAPGHITGVSAENQNETQSTQESAKCQSTTESNGNGKKQLFGKTIIAFAGAFLLFFVYIKKDFDHLKNETHSQNEKSKYEEKSRTD